MKWFRRIFSRHQLEAHLAVICWLGRANSCFLLLKGSGCNSTGKPHELRTYCTYGTRLDVFYIYFSCGCCCSECGASSIEYVILPSLANKTLIERGILVLDTDLRLEWCDLACTQHCPFPSGGCWTASPFALYRVRSTLTQHLNNLNGSPQAYYSMHDASCLN